MRFFAVGWRARRPVGVPGVRLSSMLVVALLLGLLAGCGGDDDDDPSTEPTPTPEVSTLPTTAASPTTAPDDASPTAEAAAPTAVTGDAMHMPGGDPLMGKAIEDAESDGGTLVEGWTSDLVTLNPLIADDSPSIAIQQMIFEPLVELHPDTLEAVGVLAESWDVAADGLSWTFFLREGVTWHDGEPLTADDVTLTYDLHMNEETGSAYTGDLRSKITAVEAVDPQTVRFTLPTPYADFAVDVAVYAIIPSHIWSDVAPADIAADPGSTGEDSERVVGTGPFVFTEWIPDDHATTTAYAEYWGGEPKLEEYIYKVLSDEAAGLQQLKTGEIDWLAGVPGENVGEFEDSDGVTLVDYPTTGFTFYGLNLDTEHTTLFQEAAVRQALLYALDRDAMVESLRAGYGEVAIGTMPTLSWAYDPEAIDPELRYDYDPDLARQLLDEAGWVEGDDGVREKDGEQLEFTMLTDSSDSLLVNYVTAMQEFWSEIGVSMTPETVTFPTLVESIAETFDYEAFLIGFSWGAPPDQAAMFDCDSYAGGFNVMRYCNPEVDTLLDEARVEPDREERLELYAEYQNQLLTDLPAALLDFPRLISGVNTRVHNLYPSSVNERFNAETWWVEE